MKVHSILLGMVLTPAVALAQGRIRGWFSLNVDRNQALHHSGDSSACVHLSGKGNDSVILAQPIKADHYLGKKVQLSAFVLISDWIPGFIVIRMDVDGKNGPAGSCFLHPIESTKGEWVKQPWDPNTSKYGQCDIPQDAAGMTFNLEVHSGSSAHPPSVCIDDVALTIIGKSGPADSSLPQKVPTEADKQRANQYVGRPSEFVNPSFEK